MEDYSQKYKGEHVELALFGGEYQDGVLHGLLPARGRPARRAQRAHPRAAAERGLAALHEPLRRSRRATGRRAACATPRSSALARAGGRRRCTSAAARPGAVASIAVIVAVGPVASSRRAVGRHAEHVHHDRADHAAVRDADDRLRRAGVRCARRRAPPPGRAPPSPGTISPCSQPVPPASQRA